MPYYVLWSVHIMFVCCITENIQVTEGRMRTAVCLLASYVLYHSSLQSSLTSSSCVIHLSFRPRFYFFLPLFLLILFLFSSALSYFFFITRYVVFILIFAILRSPAPLPTFSCISMSILCRLYLKLWESIRRNITCW